MSWGGVRSGGGWVDEGLWRGETPGLSPLAGGYAASMVSVNDVSHLTVQ
eukprot:gene249-455_t